ncbi:MAG: hypothetical protein LBT09_07105 [Planctomycetaceae bacterium]|nr:hypothetical protein [Planctomycetaceae bacterium]
MSNGINQYILIGDAFRSIIRSKVSFDDILDVMEISPQQRQEVYNFIRSDSDIELLYADLNPVLTTSSEEDYSKRSIEDIVKEGNEFMKNFSVRIEKLAKKSKKNLKSSGGQGIRTK